MQNHLSFLGAMQQSRPRPGDEAHGGGPGEAVRVPQSEVAPNGAVFTVLQKSRRALKKKNKKQELPCQCQSFTNTNLYKKLEHVKLLHILKFKGKAHF